jgi:hypothetical protein
MDLYELDPMVAAIAHDASQTDMSVCAPNAPVVLGTAG